MKLRFQQQSEHSECGLACVTMLIDFWKEKTLLSRMREKYGVPNGGYNLAQMQNIFKQSGLDAKAININVNSIKAVPLPFIAFWKNKHFVIVEEIKSKYILVVDPALGKNKISYSDFEKNYSNVCMYITTDRKKRFELPRVHSIFKDIFNNSKGLFIKSFLIFLIAQCISLYIPFIIRWIIDKKAGSIEVIVLQTLLLIITYFIINAFKIKIITILQTTTDKELLSKTIIQLLNLPYSYFTNRNTGELIYRINSNVQIRQILTDQLMESIVNLIFFVIYIVVMFLLNKYLAILTIIIAIIIIVFSIIDTSFLKKISQNEMTALTKSQGLINEMVNNIFTIKSTNSQKHMYDKWEENFDEQIFYEKQKAKYNALYANIPQMIQTFYTLIILILGYYLVIKDQTTVGSIIAFGTIGMSFLSPITSLLTSYTQFQTIKVYLDRLLDILQTKEESLGFGNKELHDFTGNLLLDNISYKYSVFSADVITNISLNIKEGSNVAIVGASGSGKSTFLKVAAGLYKATSGNILYGNDDISTLDIYKLREKIGVVLQENLLFNGTIKENISMGRNYSEEEILNVLKQVDLYDYVSSFPLGISAQISELGQNISGGQRQKISIARTIISKPKIIFLDEPTSSLDNISEKSIMDYLFELDSTLIVVAHRLETIKNFDNIVVLDKGKIAGMGTHSELLENNAIYKDLYKGR